MRIYLWTAVLILLLFSATAQAAYDIEQYLNIKYARDGHFSPDGQWVAYRSNESGSYQIWRLPVQGGKPEQLTGYEDAVGGILYNPVRDQILFEKDRGGDENYQLYLINGDGTNATALTESPDRRYMTPRFSPDGAQIAYTANLRNPKYFDIWVMDLDTRQTRQVRQVNGFNQIESWSPDGKRLIVATWENNYNNNLYAVDVATGEHELLTSHKGWATYDQVVWPKDNSGKKGFYLVSDKLQKFRKMALFKFKKQRLDFMDAAPWDTHNLCMSDDGRVLGYTLNAHGYSQMLLIDVKNDKYWARPRLPLGVIRDMSISKDGGRVLFTFSSPTQNTDLWIYDVHDDKVRRLTQSSTAGIDPESFVKPETVQYLGANGLDVPAFLYLPKGGKKDGSLPCLVFMHGGPEAQERPDFGITFQYFLSRGFVVFAPNVRGSAGFGKGFLHMDDGPRRMDAVRDAAMGVAWLAKIKAINPDRVGVYGASYGGYMVLALMTDYPSQFAAGVDIVGISNFVTFLERTHPSRIEIREAEYGSLKRDRTFLEQISPVHRITKIKGALMVIHGAKDPRVPKHEADQVVAKAREAGIEVEYLIYEDEGHGLRKLKNKVDAYPKMAAFFEKHLADKSADEQPEAAAEKPKSQADATQEASP